MTDQATQAEEPVQDDTVQTQVHEETQTSEPSEDENQEGAPANDEDSGQETSEEAENSEPTEIERVKQSSQKRINQMRAKLGNYERRMQEYEDRFAEIEKQQGPKAPREEDYETREEYLIAKGRFDAEQELSEKQKKERAETEAQEHQKLKAKAEQEFQTRTEKFKEKAPDFDDVANEAFEVLQSENSATSSMLAAAFMQLEDGPSLLYKLGKDPETLDDLLSQNPVQALFSLARIDSLSAAPKPQTPSKPVTPLKPKANSEKSESELSGRELRKKAGLI